MATQINRVVALLNVGLEFNTLSTPGLHTKDHVERELEKAGVKILQSVQWESDSEPTLVVRCTLDPALFDVGRAARALSQDCIAVFDVEVQEGILIGPGADKWGAFDPHHFICLDGARLDERLYEEGEA